MMNVAPLKVESKSKPSAHDLIKRYIFKRVTEHNPKIYRASLEKHLGSRIADVYFKFKDGKEVAVEVQNSPMPSKEITARTRDYANKGVYILWILNGKGKCVASPKSPTHQKNMKISPAETRLHQLYGGRTYYVNIKVLQGKIKATRPYALHFSGSDKYAHEIFQGKYSYFFVRNVNFTFIPNWKFLLSDYNGYKIARFYDKNIRNSLIESLNRFAKKHGVFKDRAYYKSKNTRNFIKAVFSKYGEYHGKVFLIELLLQLIMKKKLFLNDMILVKYKEKLKKKQKHELK